MLDTVLAKVFGTKHEREIKKIRPMVVAINDLEPQMMALSDAELAAKTVEFKQRVANGASLDLGGHFDRVVCRLPRGRPPHP